MYTLHKLKIWVPAHLWCKKLRVNSLWSCSNCSSKVVFVRSKDASEQLLIYPNYGHFILEHFASKQVDVLDADYPGSIEFF